jgi:triacylglycerol lipase
LKGTERTRNVTLQDYNRNVPVTHLNIYDDPFAHALVFDTLAHSGPADPDRARASVP